TRVTPSPTKSSPTNHQVKRRSRSRFTREARKPHTSATPSHITCRRTKKYGSLRKAELALNRIVTPSNVRATAQTSISDAGLMNVGRRGVRRAAPVRRPEATRTAAWAVDMAGEEEMAGYVTAALRARARDRPK